MGKDYKQRHEPKGHIESSGPWEVVSIDIVIPLPFDKQSQRFIVIMMDVYSRYLIAIPVRNHTAQAVSRCLYEHVVAYFGTPRSILSDRGTEFTSLMWDSLTQMLGTRKKLASPYYPQGNAVIERSHRTLNNMLRTMLLEREGQDWSTLLPSIMLYMNSMIQEQTGVSACEILFGRSPNLPSDLSFASTIPVFEDREGYVKQLKRDLKDIRSKLSQVLGQEKNQEANRFSVGEKVVIAILPHENTNKLLARWKWPFVITRMPNRFQIEYLEGKAKRLTHISYAKKFHEKCNCFGLGQLRHMVSRWRTTRRMALIRLSSSSRRLSYRRQVRSLQEIRAKWTTFSGRIRVEVCGSEADLPSELQVIVEAAGPKGFIDGKKLFDLCGQRSEERGSSCNGPSVPDILEDLALTPEQEQQALIGQVRHSSYDNKQMLSHDDSEILPRSVNHDIKNKYYDSLQVTSHPSPELIAVVRKIDRKERLQGEYKRHYVVNYHLARQTETNHDRPILCPH